LPPGFTVYDFGAESSDLPLVFATATDMCTQGSCYWTINPSRQNFNTVRVGLSYKFEAAAPVVSK